MQKILIINYQGIGNTVLMMPFFLAIKKSNLFNQIDMSIKSHSLNQLTNNHEIFDNYIYYKKHNNFLKVSSLINRIKLFLKIRKTHYDLILNMDQTHTLLSMIFVKYLKGSRKIGINSRTNFLNVYDNFVSYESRTQSESSLYYDVASQINIEIPALILPLFKTNRIKEKCDFKSESSESTKTIIIHPGCGEVLSFKKWPAQNFNQLIKEILSFGYFVKILGGPEEIELSKVILRNIDSEKCINLVGKTNITEIIDILANANLLISNDSGVMHLGASMDIPVIAIFGPTSTIKNYPLGNKTTLVNSSRSNLCNPRENHICENCVIDWKINNTSPQCLQNISVKVVLDEVKKILN